MRTLSVRPFVCLFVCLFIIMYVCLFVSLSIFHKAAVGSQLASYSNLQEENKNFINKPWYLILCSIHHFTHNVSNLSMGVMNMTFQIISHKGRSFLSYCGLMIVRVANRGMKGMQLHTSIFEEDLSYTHQFWELSWNYKQFCN